MKKANKLLATLFALALGATATVGFAGCGFVDGDSQSGTSSDSVQSDNQSAVESEMSREDYATLYSSVATSLLQKSQTTGTEETPAVQAMRSVITDIPETTDENQIKGLKMVMATMSAVVQMLADYYANEAFVVTDKSVTLTAIAQVMGMQNTSTMTFYSEIDKEAEIIYLDWYSVYPMLGLDEEVNMEEYDYAEIGYDFDGDEGVTSFRFITKRGYQGVWEYDEEKIDAEGKAYRLVEADETFKGIVDQLKDSFMSVKSEGVTLTEGNFNAEFQKYIDTVMSMTM